MKKYPPTRSNFRHLRFTGLALLLVAAIFAFGVPVTEAQTDPPPTISFNSSGLAGENLNNPTSLQFGPDGRLYVSQQNGIIFAYQVQRNGANDYEVAATEEIDLVQDYVPNHDDDGTAPSSQGSQRQITGIYVTGTGLNPILYVSSSDSRIGAGGGGQDKNLDTNSGVVSRLTCDRTGLTDACQWEKVDIVRGLPRSEENHSVNGMQLQGDKLFLAVGGLANAGSPSNNFAFITEYYHSAAILQIDLTKINALPIQEDTTLYNNYTYKWVFDMPTLDDPTRDNLNGINDPSLPGYDGIDPNDPFGGNDGLNQSRHDPTGTVSIYSPGWRNLYDIVITEQGRMYGVDNGANANWGGHPEGEQDYNNYANEYNPAVGPTCTNNYLVGEPGSVDVELPDGSKTSIGVGPGGDDKVNNKNGMHYIRPLVDGDWNFIGANLPYYGGHPAPTRGNPAGAGLYTKGSHTVDPNDGGDDYWRNQILSPGSGPNASDTFKQQSLPVDWPPSPRVGDDRINGDPIPNPVECDFRNSGQDDNAIANYGPSTNGITEYTASNFEGQLEGLLIVASFNGVLYQVQLDETGEIATNCPTPPQNGTSTLGNCQGGDDEFAKNFGATPLDVTAQGDNEIFGGTVWAATYGADNITIFEPADYDGQDTFICTSENSDLLDEDGDTYTNADEIANGTNECSGASQPADFDMAFEFGAQNQFRRSNLLDNDDDNDGLLDFGPIGTVDRFPQDCSNGIAGTCESGAQPPQVLTIPAELDFFQATGYGLVAGIGFTGVMTNGADYLTLLDHLDGDDRIVAGGTAGILTDPIVQPGTADGSTNSQLNGFQFALDVDSTNAPYSIEAQVNKTSGYLDGNPTDSQEGGIFIGTGDQDNFLKLVLRNSDTNDGTLAFGVYMESAGSEVYSYVEDVPAGTADAVAIYLYLSVDPAAGTVQPQFNLGGNTPRTDIGSAVSLPANSDILKVIQGTYTINGTPSGLAAGVIATSKDTQPYGFTWDYIYATENPSNAQAFVEVDTGGINSSTFGNGSFNITNNSEPGIEITKVTVDLETAMLPEIVFDPNGTAGDNVGKGFTPNNGSGTTTGVTTSNFASAYEGGFYDLEINFNDFNPGETLQFGVDIDPISTKGAAQPGPNESASVSGLELAGSTVTIEFSNGDTHVVELFRKPNTDGGTNNIVRNQLPAAPSINAAGVSNQSTVFTDDLTINVVTNTLEQDVKLLQFEAGQFKQADGGYSIDPWEINSLVAVAEYAESTGNSTSVAFNTTLTNQQPDDEEYGFNIFAAVAVDSDGATGPLSNFIIVKYDPNAVPDVDLRINAGGPSFTDSDNNTWEADQHFVNGSTFSNANTVDTSAPGASDQQLYSTERYNAALQYEIPLQPGAYTVELHFAEIYFGAPGGGSAGGVGSRVFDVVVEGDTKLAGYDIVADVGAVVATVKTFQNVQVLDGNLSLAFNASTNNGKISGIRVYGFSDDNAEIPISLTAIANQTSIEGADSTISIAASGGDGNLAYSANGLPLGLSVEPTNGQIFGTIAADASAGGPNNDGIYTVTVTVDDSDDNDADAQTTTFTWTVLPPPTGGAVLARINVGGPQLAAADGTLPVWSADTGANPSPYLIAVSVPTSGNPAIYTGNAGSAHTGNITADSSVPPAAPIEMFNTERYDLGPAPEMLWQFNDIVNTGDEVIVRLYFAELFGQITAPGERVFSVSVEGTTPAVYTDIDPFAVAGAKGAFMLEHPVTVDSDGVLDIEFIHGVENPAIKGIEIVAAEAIDNDPPQIVAVDDITVDEGVEASTSFSATDADSDPITLSFAIVNDSSSVAVDEADYTFTDNTDGTGSFSWTPGAATAGAYTATLTASDGISAPAVEQFAITVIGTGGTPQAIVQINPSSGGLDSSTFGNGFIINNTSPDLNITSVSYDLSTALFQDMVFDPVGTAGDAASKCVDAVGSGAADTGLTIPANGGSGTDPDCTTPFSVPSGSGGFDVMTLDFTDFNPGESINLAVDVDPTSIESATGSGNSGSVGGIELIGSTVTVTFSDGTTLTGEVYRIQPDSLTGSTNTLTGAVLSAAPTIAISGASTPAPTSDDYYDLAISNTTPTLEVSAAPNADVSLLVVEATLEVGSNGIIPPYEQNEAESVAEFDATTDGTGVASIQVPLSNTAPGTVYYVTAVVNETDGRTSDTADVWRLLIADNVPPVIADISDVSVESGSDVDVDISATDADNDPIILSIAVTNDDGGTTVDAASYTFVDNTDGTADFTWSGAPVGNYTATVMASDGNNSLVMKSFAIEVTAPTITTLNGTLNVQGRDDNSGNVTVSMYQNDAMVTETTVPVSASGEFTVPDVTPGTYDIYVKTAITLSSLQTIDMQPGANAVNFGEMLNGDANNTDKIDLVDFTILSVAFNATTGDDNFDARADFNGDGSINLVDFTLLSINFNEEGVKPTN